MLNINVVQVCLTRVYSLIPHQIVLNDQVGRTRGLGTFFTENLA